MYARKNSEIFTKLKLYTGRFKLYEMSKLWECVYNNN